MKNLWLRFGCFLTGYNYKILATCSEASAKSVKKYTSALIIVMTLWAFVGYSFSQVYLHLDKWQSAIVAFVLVIIIIQIERQVILTVGKNRLGYSIRVLIAIVMATLGSVIIDQIMFKEDIDKRKLLNIDNEVKEILPQKLKEIHYQIAELDSAINLKEKERTSLLLEITKNPSIQMPTSTIKKVPGKYDKQVIINDKLTTIKIDTIYTERVYVSKAVQNPKANLIPDIDNQIREFRTHRDELSSQKITIRNDLEKELIENVAFLDELEVMVDILMSSVVSLVVWLLWFIFFLAIELFVIISKTDNEDDYNRVIKHQLNIRLDAIDELKKNTS